MSAKGRGHKPPRNPIDQSIPLQQIAMHHRAREERNELTGHLVHDVLLEDIWRDYVIAGTANRELDVWSKYANRLANSLNLPGVHEA